MAGNYITPKGKASWAFINRPNKYGHYKIDVSFPMDGLKPVKYKGEVCDDDLRVILDDLLDCSYNELLADRDVSKKDKEEYKKHKPYRIVDDELVVTFKTSETPEVRDSTNAIVDTPPDVGNGSIVRVAFNPQSTRFAKEFLCCVKLWFNKLQIVDLIPYQGDFEPEEDEEGGYKFTPDQGMDE